MLSILLSEEMVTGGPQAFFGFCGVTCALVFASKIYKSYLDLGSAYGIAKSGVGIASVGICKPDAIMKSLVPVIMAGILGIYGLIMAVILIQKSKLL